MKFLLLQARNPGDEAREHEQDAFLEALDIERDALAAWDLLSGRPPAGLIEEFDCVLVGGAGEYGVNDGREHRWLTEFIDLCGDLADRGFPTFASCFGFQALVVAAGGGVVQDKSRAEVGTFELTVTAAGQDDPLFGDLHPSFFAQLGHKDHATDMPSGLVHLASSERSPYQALKVPGKPIYATQFHPELSMVKNRERFMRYLEGYSDPAMVDPPDKVLESFRDSSASTALMAVFVERILRPWKTG